MGWDGVGGLKSFYLGGRGEGGVVVIRRGAAGLIVVMDVYDEGMSPMSSWGGDSTTETYFMSL